MGWKTSQLKDIATITSGGTPSRSKDEYWNGDIPWVTTAEIHFNTITDTREKITKTGLDNSSAKLFPSNTLLIAMYGQGKTRGQVARLGIEAATNQACAAIILKEGFSVEYYFQFFQNQYKNIRDISNGGGQENLSATLLKCINVPVPPLLEQKKVAQILFTWDKAITIIEQLLANSQQQKKALMQQLLTGKKRFLGFGGEWKFTRLSNVCYINPKKRKDLNNERVSFISMDAVSEDAKLIRLEERLYSEMEKGFTSFEDNDVLVAKITPCFENGKGAHIFNLINKIGFGSTEFHVLRAKKSICSSFIYYLTNSTKFRIKGERNMQGSAGQKRVPTDYLKLYQIIIPPTEYEQQKIAFVLSISDREIGILQEKLTCLKQEKKALMQQLLTGKLRAKL